MNYRHHFHAGNFADVFKHALLLQLIWAMQCKEKGFLYLDTHAGRAVYDLTEAAQGDSLARKAEWPDGIGRLLGATDLPTPLAEYLEEVREFDWQHGNADTTPRFYPGSPALAQRQAREQDRLALCELHPDEFLALHRALGVFDRVGMHEIDGYTALRAMLPAPEKRALVLIDPPFEVQDEFAQMAEALREGLRRAPQATFAIWYPLTARARVDAFFDELLGVRLPPTWVAELEVAGENSGVKMRGCGLVTINPPWQLDREIEQWLPNLAQCLAQGPGATASLRWLVPE